MKRGRAGPSRLSLPDRYAPKSILGRGSFSEVFRVRDRLLGVEVALKRFRLKAPPALRSMVSEEFLFLAQISHPNLPRVHDFGTDDEGRPYFTMDYLSGPTLGDLGTGRRRPAGSSSLLHVARIAARTLSALSCIHARGIAHGDVKPSNLLFASGSRTGWPAASAIRLVDFGLSAAISVLSGQPARGTPRYMAPEVLAGEVPSAASDLFSLGLVIRELLPAGRTDRKEASDLARGLASVVSRLAAASRGARYRSADTAHGDLLALLSEFKDPEASSLRKLFCFSALPRAWGPPAAALASRLEATRGGEGGVAILSGVPARAASRITGDLRARALVSGLAFVRVPLREGGPEAVLPALASAAGEVAGEGRPAGRKGTPIGGPASLLAEASRRAGSAGAVWLVEGAERLDAAALEAHLGHLSIALRRTTALVVAAGLWRSGGGNATSPSKSDWIDFPSLEPEGIEEILSSALGEVQPLKSLARLIHEKTGGEFGSVASTVTALVRRGAVSRGRSAWVANLSAVRRISATGDEYDASLPPLSRTDLTLARRLSILGPTFEEGEASVVTGLKGDRLEALLAKLRATGRLLEIGQVAGGRRWSFAAPSLAESLAAGLGAPARRKLHRAVARFLERPGARPDSGALARHLLGSGEAPAAARLWLASGRESALAHDLVGACGDLERALGAVPASERALADEVRYELASVLHAAGHAAESRLLLEKLVATRARRLPEGVKASDILLLQARNLEMLGRPAESVPLLDEAMTALPASDSAGRSRVLRAQGWLALEGNRERAEALEREAREEAAKADDPIALAAAHSLRGHILRVSGLPTDAEREFQGAIDLCRRAGDPAQAASELHNLALVWIRRDPHKALDLLLEAGRESRKMGLDNLLTSVLMNQALVERTIGDWEAAVERYRSSIDVGSRIGARGIHRAYMNLGNLLADRGEFEEAAVCFERSARLLTGQERTRSGVFVELNRARLALRRDQPDEALRILEAAAVSPALTPKDTVTWINLHDYRATALAELGRVEEAIDASEIAKRAAMDQEEPFLKGEALLYGAFVLRIAGRREEAHADLDRAVALLRGVGHEFYAARARLERAELLRFEPGSAARGLEEATAARGVFERLGATPFVAKAGAVQRRHQEAVQRSLDAPRELRALHAISDLLAAGDDLPVLLEGILDAAIDLLGAERGLIFLVRPGREMNLVKAAARGMAPSEETDVKRISLGILKRALGDDTPLVSGDATQDSRFRSLKSVIRYQIHSFICAPLRTGDQILGTIYVDHCSMNHFSDAEARFMQALSGFASPAIQGARGRLRLAREVDGLRAEVQALRREGLERFGLSAIVAESAAMKAIIGRIERAAAAKSTVLITGQTGTGKEIVARVIHNTGPRSGRPFVAVNCASLSGPLVESELFGHVKGAFTDAVADRPGRFEMADGGTLFLDEINSLPWESQGKLLRVLEDQKVAPVGGTSHTEVDVRVIAATSSDLGRLVKEERFRADLFFRLNVLAFHLPPLKERREDIEPLLRRFVETFCEENGRPPLGIPAAVLEEYRKHDWPGNVRELRNYVERAVAQAQGGDLPPLHATRDEADSDRGLSLGAAAAEDRTLRDVASRYVETVFLRCGSRKNVACRILGINYRTLERHLRRRSNGS